MKTSLRILNRNALKYIAIIAMLLDHVAEGFLPQLSWQYQLMRFIGRLTGPVMAFFIAEGFIHTHDRDRYGKRLAIFALISWVPYSLFRYDGWPSISQSVIFTLLLGYVAIYIWDREDISKSGKIVTTAALCGLSILGDWGVSDVLWPVFFFIYKDKPVQKWLSYYIAAALYIWPAFFDFRGSMYNLGLLFVPIILIFLYNGEGGSKKAIHKWFFYVFYPLHLLVLFILKKLI